MVICNLSRRLPEENISLKGQKAVNHFPCDLTDAAAVARTAATVQTFLVNTLPAGRILLINNSGFGAFGHFPEPHLPRQLAMIDLNIRAVVHLTGLLLPLLRTRGGVIINVASTVAFQPTAYAATYGASKAFVLHWTLALNEELRGTGVSALALCPGTTTTDFFEAAGVGPGATVPALSMTSDAVVDAALRALAAGSALVVPGWKNQLLTFFSAKLPKPLVTRIAAKILARLRLKGGAP